MDEGDEDENIPELVNIENFTYGMPFPTSPSRVPIMSAHDERPFGEHGFPQKVSVCNKSVLPVMPDLVNTNGCNGSGRAPKWMEEVD